MKKEKPTPRKAPNARNCAISLLCQWSKSASAIDLLIEQEQKKLPDPRDKQLLKAIVYGVLRHLNQIDWVIGQFSKHPIGKMKPITLQSLRSGVVQLLFMDRLPPSAVINETIKAMKGQKQPKWLTGFVNGVLRNVDRARVDLLNKIQATRGKDNSFLNHPNWLLKRWQKRYGMQRTLEICQANNCAAGLCLRINGIEADDFMAQLSAANIVFEAGKYVPEALWLPEYRGPVHELPGYQEGHFFVQDEIAQLICYMLPIEVTRVVDGCAGLGGKTALLAQRIGDAGQIIAVEPQLLRQELLNENLQRLGLKEVDCFTGTLADFVKSHENDGQFDAVLLDVPCSGIGVTGRHPDIRWNRRPDDLLRFQKQQLELIDTAVGLLKAGGTLVYATCSIEPEENEQVIDSFLKTHPQFMVEDPASLLPEYARSLIDERGFLKTLPGKEISDGFFAVRLIALPPADQ